MYINVAKNTKLFFVEQSGFRRHFSCLFVNNCTNFIRIHIKDALTSEWINYCFVDNVHFIFLWISLSEILYLYLPVNGSHFGNAPKIVPFFSQFHRNKTGPQRHPVVSGRRWGPTFVCFISYNIVSPSPYELRPASMMPWLLSPL